MTDGVTVANVADPETTGDVALSDGARDRVLVLPSAEWVASWKGIGVLTPLPGRPGYLLMGASAVVVISDGGDLSVDPLPSGYVALAPTSDPKVFLLANSQDASEAGALSESTPFAVYLWTLGSQGAPRLMRAKVVAVRPSTTGLAWLRAAEGSWWLLEPDAVLTKATSETRERSEISPDGRYQVFFPFSRTGCVQDGADPCPVRVVTGDGGARVYDGPASGVTFMGGEIGMILYQRRQLGLPWRLLTGPVDNPSLIEVSADGFFSR